MSRLFPLLSRARLACLAALTLGVVVRADIPWQRPTLSLRAEQQPVADLLRSLADEHGLALALGDAEELSTPISGDFTDFSPQTLLDTVCTASGLIWFWDGNRLHIEAAARTQVKVLTLTTLTPEKSNELFASLGFRSGPNSRALAVRGENNVVTLQGGQRFLEIAEPVLRAHDTQETERAASAQEQQEEELARLQAADRERIVQVFRLKHAYASDITVRGGSAQSVIPGVARALQNIMGQNTAALSTGTEGSDRPRVRSGLRGTGLAAIGTPTTSANTPTSDRNVRGKAATDAPSEVQALIQADPRLNAIIVRDVAARMPMYANLIAQLDVPTPVIEIAASVVDIEANNGKSLGVEFLSFGDGRNSTKTRLGFEADRSFNQGNNDNTGSQPTFVDGTDVVRGEGFNSSVLVPVSGYQLLTRIRALEEKGQAQLLTSPSVITLENVEAVLRQEETVFVKVAGQESSDLFDVRTGVQLRVTPTVVGEGDSLTFRLLVDVQDGAFSDLSVDGIPSTKESAISTQALVPGDRTLLIGGYFVDRKVNNTRQVPLLGDIPVLGRLFKRTENNVSRAQRFFFITPRLVDVQSESRAKPTPEPSDAKGPEALTDKAKTEELARQLAGQAIVHP